jgi:hypothetical protein
MTARLASSVVIAALMRRVQGDGGNAAVLARGDETAGAILLVIASRGETMRLLSRRLDASGGYIWDDLALPPPGGESGESSVAELVERARRRDPDLWVVELDIADAQRFADELTVNG